MNYVFSHIKQQIVVICCFLFLSSNLWAQPQVLSPETKVSVLTCGVGDELYSIFGHTAIRFQDREQNMDVVFNYGTFDFRTPNFYAKFVKGDLMYHLSADTYSNFVYSYEEDNRSIQEQFLNLSLPQKQKIWDHILLQLNSDKRFYQYKFIDNNCTTKVADLLNEVLPAPLNGQFEGNNATYRQILNTYLDNHYFEKLGINLIFGDKVDHVNEQLVFLPNKLWTSINRSTNGDESLLLANKEVFKAATTSKFYFFNSYAFFLIVCLFFSAFLSYKSVRSIWMIVLGLLGVFFIAVAFYSLHKEVQWNNVVLLCNPLYLVYIFVQNRNWKIRFLYLFALLLTIFCFWIGLEKLFIFSPLIMITFVALLGEFKNIKKNLINVSTI